jgi:glycosyltransferase involved in cell wall biosynthesis
MSFNPKALSKALGDIHIDLVYTNDPCKVLAYKTFFYHKQNEFLPVMTRNHWVTGKIHRKVPEEIDFIIRQVEGSYIADFASYNSKSAKRMMIENAKEFFNDKVEEKLDRTGFVTETVDAKKVDKYKTSKDKDSKFTILFAHRLSYYTGWEEAFDALKELYESGMDFTLIAPDPGNKFTQRELKKRYPFLQEIDKSSWSHEDYLRTCWKADLAIGNHNIPTTWGGLALTEPMAAYTVPIMPKKDGYLEMFFREYDNEIFFENMEDFKRIVKAYYDSPESLEKMKKEARRFVNEKLNMDDFISSIDNALTASLYF